MTLLKVIALSILFKDLTQTVGLPISSFTVSGDIKKKEKKEKKALKMTS